MAGKVFFHVDVNSAFLSWEAVYRMRELGETEDLRTIPSAVGGDVSKRHGIILAKSIPAKKFHIHTAEPVIQAVRKCPALKLVPPNYEVYKQFSDAFFEILNKYSPDVEKYSIDEAFLDMTGMENLYGSPLESAVRLKDEIFDTLGFTVNIGISENKLLAKMASDFEKPNRVHTLFPNEIAEKMWPLPVGDLFLVGKSSVKKLQNIGIHTIGDLAHANLEILTSVLKKHGKTIWNFANGRDMGMMDDSTPESRSYSNETTVSFDVTDAETAKMVLLSLAENVGWRLRQDNARAELVSVMLRYSDLRRTSHQRVLPQPTNITTEIYKEACRLFDDSWNGEELRQLGLQAGRVMEQESVRQISLFDTTDYEKLEKMDKAVDVIREKFGSNAVMRASFLSSDKIPPITGRRKSREK
ncbi:MAG: DNA polymerase IV [Eubacterium sp.]|nr:DNA polymerase IV [Eubacterium sp.]